MQQFVILAAPTRSPASASAYWDRGQHMATPSHTGRSNQMPDYFRAPWAISVRFGHAEASMKPFGDRKGGWKHRDLFVVAGGCSRAKQCSSGAELRLLEQSQLLTECLYNFASEMGFKPKSVKRPVAGSTRVSCNSGGAAPRLLEQSRHLTKNVVQIGDRKPNSVTPSAADNCTHALGRNAIRSLLTT